MSEVTHYEVKFFPNSYNREKYFNVVDCMDTPIESKYITGRFMSRKAIQQLIIDKFSSNQDKNETSADRINKIMSSMTSATKDSWIVEYLVTEGNVISVMNPTIFYNISDD